MLAIRGIIYEEAPGFPLIKICVKNLSTGIYTTHIWPDWSPFNKNRLILFIAGIYNIEPDQIIWPEHLSIPGSLKR